MRKLQRALTPPLRLRWPLLTAAGLLSGLVWAMLIRLIDTHSIRHTLAALAAPNLWLTALFLGLMALTLSLLTNSLFAGNLLVGLPSVLLALVNYFKVLLTQVPLSLTDFSLIGQVGHIAQLNSQSITFDRNSVLAILGAVLWLLLALFFSAPLRLRWRRSAPAALISALIFALVFWVGADRLIYTPLGVGVSQLYSQTTANQSCGLVLGLWRTLYCRANPMTSGEYSQQYMDDILAQTEAHTAGLVPTQPEEAPNIILVLSESFFDPTKLEGVSYPTDPVAEFRALREEGVGGDFYTKTLGYGTCNIELEIFTGINTALLSGEDLYSWDGALLSTLPTVPGLLRENGYYTAMLHMFNDEIYNRSAFFHSIGFQDLYFSGDFSPFYAPAAQAPDYWGYMNSRISGEFYSDDLMSDLIISLYEHRKEQSEQPVFLYGISMENHSPFPGDKYAPEALTVSPQSPLSGEAADSLLSLSQGIANASAALDRLVDYFRTVDEPVVIVFYGDHRPGLGLSQGGTVYSQLGIIPSAASDWSLADHAEVLSTDYLIWSNDPDYLPAPAGSTVDSGCSYLGARLLELSGVELPLHWKLISRLSQSRLADTMNYHLGADGTLSADLPTEGEGAQGLHLLKWLLHDAIYGSQYVTQQLK